MQVEVEMLLQTDITSTMAGIAQNEQKRLIFIVFPQVRTKVKEKGKREKNKQTNELKTKQNIKQNKTKHENGCVKGNHTNIYPYLYIYTPTDIQTYINTDTHIHIHILCVIQVKFCLEVFKLFAFLTE